MKTSRKLISILICFLLIGFSFVSAQSNDLLDDLLAQDPAQLGITSYLILAASDHISSNDSPSIAFQKAQELNLIKKTDSEESKVRADTLSLMLMKALEIQGGIMYRVFPTPRFAYKHLVYLGYISDAAGPARIVAGDEVVRVLGYLLEYKGGNK